MIRRTQPKAEVSQVAWRTRSRPSLHDRQSRHPPPEYDGSPRVAWLAEQLIAQQYRGEIERLLCRICDPVEYDDGRVSAKEFLATVNAKLEPGRLVISLVSGRPVLGEVDDGAPHYAVPENLEVRLRRLLEQRSAVDRLMIRARETQLCEQGAAHMMAIIGIDSFVEGLLYRLFMERDSHVGKHGFTDRKGRMVRPDRAGLNLLIETPPTTKPPPTLIISEGSDLRKQLVRDAGLEPATSTVSR